MCRKLILGRNISWGKGWGCATSLCDLDLTFVLAVVTLIYNVMSVLYLGNCKM